MANELDEMSGPVNTAGRDVNVIEKQIPVRIGAGSYVFIVFLWLAGIIPGIVFTALYIKAKNYLRGLQQRIQHDASQIDNYLEQRVVVLQGTASLVNKAIDLDKDTMKSVAALRTGLNPSEDVERNNVNQQIEDVNRMINITLERYPDLKAHGEIQDAIQKNDYLQREITAAREVYNDTVNQWNHDIMQWPAKMIAAARSQYTTRVPFSTSVEIKKAARTNFFE